MAEQQSASGGIGFGGAVFIAFLVLKLTGIIDWSWWWVTCPLWIPIAVGIIAFILWIVIAQWRIRKHRNKLQRRIKKLQQEREQLLSERKNRTNNI